MKRSFELILIIIFCILLAAPGVIGLLLPDRVFSESENRNLAMAPKLSLSSVLSGDFMKKFESYVTDQFVLRDGWVFVKANAEMAAFKKANNGVELANGRLIKYVEEPEKEDIDKKLETISSFASDTEADVTFALIPSAACIYKDELSNGAPTADEDYWIDYCSKNAGAKTVDVTEALKTRKDEYIYYRTDHHYTSLGAGIVAQELLKELAPDASFDIASYTPELVSTSFEGTGRNSFGADLVQADSIYKYVSEKDKMVYANEKGALKESCMYNEEALTHSNQYPYFLGGNTPLCIIESKAEGEKILLVRDSFADELAPFLSECFSQVHLLDLRYYKGSVKDYIKENGIEKVLIIYSFPDFVTDTGIRLLGR